MAPRTSSTVRPAVRWAHTVNDGSRCHAVPGKKNTVNTLGKTVTSRFFATESGYAELRSRWAKIMQDKNARKALTSTHHALYAVLIGRDWRKGFTAPKQSREDSVSPESVINGLYHAARSLNAKPNLCYYVQGDIVAGTSGYRPFEAKETANPFFGLLSENAPDLIDAVLPSFDGAYLPENAYQEVAA